MQAHNASSSDLNFGTEVRFPMTKHKRKLKILSIDQERTFAEASKTHRHRAEKAELKTEEPADVTATSYASSPSLSSHPALPFTSPAEKPKQQGYISWLRDGKKQEGRGRSKKRIVREGKRKEACFPPTHRKKSVKIAAETKKCQTQMKAQQGLGM